MAATRRKQQNQSSIPNVCQFAAAGEVEHPSLQRNAQESHKPQHEDNDLLDQASLLSIEDMIESDPEPEMPSI